MPGTRRAVPEGPAAAVCAVGLEKRYGEGANRVSAIDGVSLTIEPGEAVALMGASGSGKSTLLHLIGAMDQPSAGEIRVGSWNVSKLAGNHAAEYRRRVGFVFQTFNLLTTLSALDNVLAPRLPAGVSRKDVADAIALLDRVGLANRVRAMPGTLSGGEQQRVAIARAAMGRPLLILADEPTGSLDSRNGDAVMDLLLSLRQELGTTLLVATHNPEVAARLDKVVQLRDGSVVPDGASH